MYTWKQALRALVISNLRLWISLESNPSSQSALINYWWRLHQTDHHVKGMTQ